MVIGIILGILVIIGLGLYIIKPKTPKPPVDIVNVSDLEQYLKQVVAAEHPPGLSVAVVKDDTIVYANGFGVADAPGNIVTTKETIYHWWSMTKIPTAVAVMQLHERGLININDPIQNYLAYIEVTYKNSTQQISIRQLLNHSAGFSNAAPEIFTWLHTEDDPPVNQTAFLVEKFPDYSELLYMPGEKTQYSNFGYMILGALIEEVTGQTYEQYMLDNILLPLGMHNTNYVYTDAMAENEATGSQHIIDMYTPFFPLLKLNHIIRERVGLRLWFDRVYNDQTPPTGLIGPVSDIALFMMDYLSESSVILDQDTVLMMNDAMQYLTSPGSSTRGLGWDAHLSKDGRRYLTHSGGGPGFATIFRVYPDENLGIVVMGNDSTISRDLLADVIANVAW